MNEARTLVYTFLGLPHITKIEIAQQFNLLQDGDEDLAEAELWKLVFNRAKAADVLTDFWESIRTA